MENSTWGGIQPVLVTAGECSLTRFYTADKMRAFCVTLREKKRGGGERGELDSTTEMGKFCSSSPTSPQTLFPDRTDTHWSFLVWAFTNESNSRRIFQTSNKPVNIFCLKTSQSVNIKQCFSNSILDAQKMTAYMRWSNLMKRQVKQFPASNH